MEELAPVALLECPLCLKQLDGSAKVLPCKHALCTACLQRREAAQSPPLCPECRAPVPAGAAAAEVELPGDPEGLRGSPGPGKDRQAARHAGASSRGGSAVREGQQQQQQQQEGQHREKHSEVSA